MLPQLVSSYLADPGFFNVPLPMRLGLAAMPAWLNHMTTNAVIDGDGVLVYGQVLKPLNPNPMCSIQQDAKVAH